MSLFNAIFNSVPSSTPAPAATVLGGVDTNAGALWLSTPESAGWVPVSQSVARSSFLSQSVATNANVLTLTAPATGLYDVFGYSISTDATSGTLPAINVAYTEGDTGGSNTAVVVADKGSVEAANVVNEGSVFIFAKAGTNIVVSSASAASLTYNIKARIAFLG